LDRIGKRRQAAALQREFKSGCEGGKTPQGAEPPLLKFELIEKNY
jgi:hypothetical protein